jgi:transposase
VEHYAGIDVSLELSSVCVVDGQGKMMKEAKVASEPEALVCFFKELGFSVKRIGLEAGPLSQWLHAGLAQAGFETVLLETRHVKAVLSAMTVKTDRKDARRCGRAGDDPVVRVPRELITLASHLPIKRRQENVAQQWRGYPALRRPSGLHSCCGWGGSSRCTPNRLDRRRSGRCWLRASSFSEGW